MKQRVSIFLFLAVLFLAGCVGVNTSGSTPEVTHTPLPPKLDNQPLPTATLEPTQTLVPPSATSTSSAATMEQPSPTPANATPTTAALTPTVAVPTTTIAAPTPTVAVPTPTVAAPTPTPLPAQGSSGDAGAAGGCVDKAAFYSDVTVPDNTSFKQNVEFVKTWQIKNVGTCTGQH